MYKLKDLIVQSENNVDDVKTIGDLKQLLFQIDHQLKSGNRNKLLMQGGMSALKTIVGFIPIAGGIANIATQLAASADDIVNVGKILFKLNDPNKAKQYKFKSNSHLEKFLHIDPSLSNILQDAIQKSFMQHLGQYIKTFKDSDPIPDLSQLLRNYINNNFLFKNKQSKLQKFKQSKTINQQVDNLYQQFEQAIIQKPTS